MSVGVAGAPSPGSFPALLTLTRGEADRFRAPEAVDKGERMFGGQFLAQSIAAAYATLEPERQIHSLHAYFLRPGDVHSPVDLEVERIRDGRGFSSRGVVAAQAGKPRFRMQASFQVPVSSPEYAGSAMPPAPSPEGVRTTYLDFTLAQTGADTWPGADRPIEIRYVNPPRERGLAVTERQLMWMRVRGPLGADDALHRAGLAYLSDATIVDHVMLPHGMRWQDADFEGASLDHAMWFYRAARVDEWLLFVQEVELTGSGRGLVKGQFFDRGGHLVAVCVQEGLMRWA